MRASLQVPMNINSIVIPNKSGDDGSKKPKDWHPEQRRKSIMQFNTANSKRRKTTLLQDYSNMNLSVNKSNRASGSDHSQSQLNVS